MSPQRTISLPELLSASKDAYQVKIDRLHNEVIVDGFKRFNATDRTINEFERETSCTSQPH